ncbi:MAG TPA: hypothetical protein VG694_01870 [Candidatus Paceibacterota bacterium]|nr:hypothetical protein [Candidatus Paceibacterota bacterium]
MKKYLKIVLVFVCAGLLFSGYLSAVKLFTSTCAFNEGCPYFLGYPACWYGFAMYLIMLLITIFSLGGSKIRGALKADAVVSFLGIIFAGSFVVQEVARSQVTGSLGLSTCAYGLIFYILIFILSLAGLKQKEPAVPMN